MPLRREKDACELDQMTDYSARQHPTRSRRRIVSNYGLESTQSIGTKPRHHSLAIFEAFIASIHPKRIKRIMYTGTIEKPLNPGFKILILTIERDAFFGRDPNSARYQGIADRVRTTQKN